MTDYSVFRLSIHTEKYNSKEGSKLFAMGLLDLLKSNTATVGGAVVLPVMGTMFNSLAEVYKDLLKLDDGEKPTDKLFVQVFMVVIFLTCVLYDWGARARLEEERDRATERADRAESELQRERQNKCSIL